MLVILIDGGHPAEGPDAPSAGKDAGFFVGVDVD